MDKINKMAKQNLEDDNDNSPKLKRLSFKF